MIVVMLGVLLVFGSRLAFAAEPEASGTGPTASTRGAFEESVTHWKKAARLYEAEKNVKGQAEALVNLGVAYQSLGHERLALQTLEESVRLAEKSGDRTTLLLARTSLGAAYASSRHPADAERYLRETLAMANADQDEHSAAVTLNNLGNLLADQGKTDEALDTLKQCAAGARHANDPALVAKALGNAAAAAAQTGRLAEAEQLNAEAIKETRVLVASHDQAMLLLRTGQTDWLIAQRQADAGPRLLGRAREDYQQALAVAEQLGDRRGRSYALGYLGQVAETEGQTVRALELTRQAAFVAQEAQSADALYRWEWQTGRLHKKLGDRAEAIAAYRRALQTLRLVGLDLRAGYCATCLPFRQTVGPMFFELADLLLQQAAATPDPRASEPLLREARDVVERLKSVELQDYFGDECVALMRGKTTRLESVGRNTAVVYYICLPDRLEVLLGLTSGLTRFTVPVTAEQLTATVRQFRLNLEKRTTHEYRTPGKQLYAWLIDPIKGSLADREIDTLVFVPDAALRTIPMAALYDGKQFLIEQYAVAVTPGLTLMEPKPMSRTRLIALVGGLSEAVQNFPALPYVTNELHEVSQSFRGPELVDQGFVIPALKAGFQHEQYQLVHFATHGQFDREAGRSFILTYDGRLTLDQLEDLIRPSQFRGKPVELLALSACQTAAGDDRAALGLAGVAVKAGARSALATLWFVHDQSTALLMSEFYGLLGRDPDLSKAKALQHAQIKVLADPRYRHPCYWAPFLIIGNWL